MVLRSAGILGVAIDAAGAREIASRSRGTPRIANRLLRRVRDFVETRRDGVISAAAASDGLTQFGVDAIGLDKVDRRILGLLTGQFAALPVGLTTLAHACGEETATVEDAYEPFLMREGFIIRTPRGRIATEKAFRHLNVQPPGGGLV